jgi:hypothetical protein
VLCYQYIAWQSQLLWLLIHWLVWLPYYILRKERSLCF